RGEPRRGGRLREDRGPADLPLVQLPRGVPSRAATLPGRGRGGGSRVVKALLVDLDDTLLDYTGGVESSWLEACTCLGAPAGLDPASVASAIGRARRWFWSDPERHRRERVAMLDAWRKIAERAFEELGAPDGSLAAAIAHDFAERRWQRM